MRPAVVFDSAGYEYAQTEIVSMTSWWCGINNGIYFGEPRGVETEDGQRMGFLPCATVNEIRRIAPSVATAMQRGKKLCSIDKANLWMYLSLARNRH